MADPYTTETIHVQESFEERVRRVQHEIADKMRLFNRPLVRGCIGEFLGTAILMILGNGVLAQVFLGDHDRKMHGNFFSISFGWGMAVMMGVFFAGRLGHGIINPAVSVAFGLVGRLPLNRVLWYCLAEFAGAFFGSLLVFGTYTELIYKYANLKDNGTLKVNTTGGIFVTNPGASTAACLFDQVIGTALLAAGALSITDKSWEMPDYLHPPVIGLYVVALVGAFALNAGAALNPARDLGPRIMISLFGK
ncbi:unnamed protein product [Protopolystoma xenopodis]|uniref:Aquaporin n=1 Tax=Protopolystoma xenopodis TaxID=117903 RepID=A0A3S5FGU6_9PLAT|nr:unnamed protein product [Protopolystoma xenopodis]